MKVLLYMLQMLSMRRAHATGGKVMSTSDAITVSVMFGIIVCAALSLTACGGSDTPVPQQVAKPIIPPIVIPALPASDASAPVAASAPSASAPVSASAPASASQPAPEVDVEIDVYGDDAMMGLTAMNMGMPTMAQTTEPQGAQTLLRAQFGNGITINNHATGGTASMLVNMMAGMDGGGPPFIQRIATSKAVIVLDNHAINDDLMQSLGPYADALVQWIQDVRAAGKVPVLEEPNPVCDDNHPHLDNYVATIDNIALAYNVPVVKQYDYILGLPNWQSHMSGCLLPDEWLLNVKAQRQAAVLATVIQQLKKN